MMTEERIALVEAVIRRYRSLDSAWQPIISAFKTHDFPAFEESWRSFDAYLLMVADKIGDESYWLYWFIYDNKIGENALSAKAASWKKAAQLDLLNTWLK